MRINVAQLLKEPVGSIRNYRIDNNIGEECIDSVKGDLVLTRTNRSILVTGTLTATVTGICTRCLDKTCCTYSFKLEEEFFPRTDISSGSVSPAESDDSNTVDNNNMLDLAAALRQYTILSVPTKILCSQDCDGLCPSCGHNLNQGKCQCPSQAHEERLSKLVSLGKENKI